MWVFGTLLFAGELVAVHECVCVCVHLNVTHQHLASLGGEKSKESSMNYHFAKLCLSVLVLTICFVFVKQWIERKQFSNYEQHIGPIAVEPQHMALVDGYDSDESAETEPCKRQERCVPALGPGLLPLKFSNGKPTLDYVDLFHFYRFLTRISNH